MSAETNKFPYLLKEIARGKTFWYFRIGKGPRIRIKSEYGSRGFTTAYRAALLVAKKDIPNDGKPTPPKPVFWTGKKPPHALVIPPEIIEAERDTGSHVYFVLWGDRVKIGVAKDVKKRMSALKVSCPEHLELVHVMKGGRRLEAFFHQRFALSRLRGEWFDRRGVINEFLGSVTATDGERESPNAAPSVYTSAVIIPMNSIVQAGTESPAGSLSRTCIKRKNINKINKYYPNMVPKRPIDL